MASIPVEKPQAPRYTIEKRADSLIVSFPNSTAMTKWGAFVLLCCCGIMWLSVAAGILYTYLTTRISALLGPALAWMLVSILIAVFFWWLFSFRLLIEVTPQSFLVHTLTCSRRRSKNFSAQQMRDLRAAPASAYTPYSAIVFDYGARTIRVVGSIDEAEAKQIVATIKNQFPQYGETP